jgi:hypothetical protein
MKTCCRKNSVSVPYLIKNYGSHIISEQQRANMLKKISSVFSKLRPQPDKAEAVRTEKGQA